MQAETITSQNHEPHDLQSPAHFARLAGWICRYCHSHMLLDLTPGDELVLSCQNPRCQWTIAVECEDILHSSQEASHAL